MQKAEQILQALRKLGEQRLPLTRIYRMLYSEEMYLVAYNKLYRNDGALTPGTEDDTVDGMSIERIQRIIEQLRYERFRFRPSQRTRIPKKSGGLRPISRPNFTEKHVQEVMRMILEAYYEPRFSDRSHGFRPERGCHTALTEVKQKFRGTTWFIEGDIKGCFDNINHDILMSILARDIHDGRFLNLIRLGLEAGVIEDWKYERTHSGTPQGGVLSPLLANIYLNELDTFIEQTLIPRYTKGKRRRENVEYRNYVYKLKKARQQGNLETVRRLEQARRQLPSQDVNDPNFRRLHYIRYADDFLLGFTGSKAEAEQIKAEIGAFLREKLGLEMSASKTFITHARTEHAKFLGYAVSVYHADDKLSLRANTKTVTRSVNSVIRLGIPYGLVDELCKRYMRNGKPIHEAGMLFQSDADIIDAYQKRFRGVAEYYKFAVDRHHLGKLKYIMEQSLVSTLAGKFKTSGTQIYAKYKGKREVNGREYKTLQVEVPTSRGSTTIYWGAIPLKVVKVGTETIEDVLFLGRGKNLRSDLIQRLKADTCELCGRKQKCEVHHVHKLADLKKRWQGRKAKPEWVIRMIAMQRKSLIVCKDCHRDIHAGRPIPKDRK